jgi:hypothetical protein
VRGRATAAALVALTLAGCAIRYDQTGVSRVGVFLWGLGDPPGVNWNLDWPRREIPELPPSTRRELAPREPARAPVGPPGTAPGASAPERSRMSIDDNPERAPSRVPESTSAALARLAGADGDDTARR